MPDALPAATLLVFAGALAVAAALPGPGIAALVARVLGRGPEGAIPFAAGMVLGDMIWLSSAIGSLAVLANTFYALFAAVRYLGAAYLLYLAVRLWTAPAAPQALAAETRRERPARLFLGGLALCLGNPKVMMFYLALLPSLVDLGHVGWAGAAELVGIIPLVLGSVLAGYVLLAARARRLFMTPRALRLLNRGTGVVMAGAAAAVATR